jgi:hypothetical protein
VPHNNAARELHTLRITKRLHQTERDWPKGYSLHRWRLTESRVRLGRDLAAFLTMMTAVIMRVATHGLAALHRLLMRSRTHTVESMRREGYSQGCDKAAFCRPHHRLTNTGTLHKEARAACVEETKRVKSVRQKSSFRDGERVIGL